MRDLIVYTQWVYEVYFQGQYVGCTRTHRDAVTLLHKMRERPVILKKVG